AQGARDVAVIARIAHRRGQDPVDEDRARGLVDLVLDRLRVLGDLDDDVDFVGGVLAGGDEVQAHCALLRGENVGERGAILRAGRAAAQQGGYHAGVPEGGSRWGCSPSSSAATSSAWPACTWWGPGWWSRSPTPYSRHSDSPNGRCAA